MPDHTNGCNWYLPRQHRRFSRCPESYNKDTFFCFSGYGRDLIFFFFFVRQFFRWEWNLSRNVCDRIGAMEIFAFQCILIFLILLLFLEWGICDVAILCLQCFLIVSKLQLSNLSMLMLLVLVPSTITKVIG